MGYDWVHTEQILKYSTYTSLFTLFLLVSTVRFLKCWAQHIYLSIILLASNDNCHVLLNTRLQVVICIDNILHELTIHRGHFAFNKALNLFSTEVYDVFAFSSFKVYHDVISASFGSDTLDNETGKILPTNIGHIINFIGLMSVVDLSKSTEMSLAPLLRQIDRVGGTPS